MTAVKHPSLPQPFSLSVFAPALQVLCRYKNIWNVSLQLRPTLIAGIMKDSGMKAAAFSAGI